MRTEDEVDVAEAPRAALYGVDRFWAKAIAATGGTDDDTVHLVERWLAIDFATKKFARELGELMARPGATEGFRDECLDRFKMRADLADLELRDLLIAWEPIVFEAH